MNKTAIISTAISIILVLIGVVYGLNVSAVEKLEKRQECIRDRQSDHQAQIAVMRSSLNDIKEDLTEIKSDIKKIVSAICLTQRR